MQVKWTPSSHLINLEHRPDTTLNILFSAIDYLELHNAISFLINTNLYQVKMLIFYDVQTIDLIKLVGEKITYVEHKYSIEWSQILSDTKYNI